MDLKTLLIPLIAVLAVVAVAAATTTALVVARPENPAAAPTAELPLPQQAPSNTPTPVPTPDIVPHTPTPVPTPDIVLEFPPILPEPPDRDRLDPDTLQPGTDESTDPKPTPKATLDRGPKGSRIPPGPVGDSSSRSASGDVYTWQDGSRTIRVVLQDNLAAQSKSDTTSQDVIVAKMGDYSIVEGNYKPGAQPVFRAESGGGLMILPGGVMLLLDPEWDQGAVEKFLERNDIDPGKASELDFLQNGFFVETEPGIPSLELANSLTDEPGVIVSSPNWQQQFETR